MKRLLLLTALLCVLAAPLAAQVPVSMAPVTKFQFLSNAGIPFAAGCVFTYQAGTVNPATTYIDSTGTSTNTNPIILDGAGRADIFLPNAAFKFQLKSAGGVNCATGSTIWTVDNITGVLGLLNLTNTWTGQNTFNQPIIIAVNANQIVAGLPGAQTTLNFPAPAGNITQNMLSVADTYVGLAASQTLTNKTLTSPTLNNPNINGTVVTGPPATYLVMANNVTTGTTVSKLAKIDPSGLAGFALISSAGDTGGVVGVVVAGAGITGNATIQQNGSASCVFDNAVTAGDYVQISTSVAGDCHDSGATYPVSGQVIGRLLATNVAVGTYLLDLFGPEIKAVGINTVYSTTSATSAANIGATTMATAGGSGNIYQIQFYPTQIGVGAGCVSATTIQANLTWTDPNAAGPTTVAISILYSIVNNGTANSPIVTGTGVLANLPYTIRAKAATAVQYSTTYSLGGSCAPGPTYQITPVMVQLQ